MRARDLALHNQRPEGVVDLVDKSGQRLQLVHLGEVPRPAGRSSSGRPLSLFREANTGLLRVAHRELVLRFAHRVSDARRRAILADARCTIRRVNPFFADQVVVVQSIGWPAGSELIALANHPNLRPSLWRNPDPAAPDPVGRDFSVGPEDPGHFDPRPKRFDPSGGLERNDVHGTPCTGLVAATGIDGGSVGVAPGCRILPVKIFRGDDLACDEGVANAIRYAALHADILSCSWSGGGGPDVRQALEDAGTLGRRGLGSAVFCSAGNGHGAPVAFPASDPGAVAVGASTDQGAVADYSNHGPEMSVVAPSSGGSRRIFTTDVSLPGRGLSPGDLHTGEFGGTSAATAITAGVAALVLSVHPGLDRCELKDLLEETAEKVGGGYNALGHSLEAGYGRVDAGRAVEEAARRVSAPSACSGTAYSTKPLSCFHPPRSS